MPWPRWRLQPCADADRSARICLLPGPQQSTIEPNHGPASFVIDGEIVPEANPITFECLPESHDFYGPPCPRLSR